jgi:hypothetical protein
MPSVVLVWAARCSLASSSARRPPERFRLGHRHAPQRLQAGLGLALLNEVDHGVEHHHDQDHHRGLPLS